MLRIVAALLLAAFADGCASQALAPASQAELDAAHLAYIRCLDQAATDLDDHRSDASTVAMAIQSMCTAEFRRTVVLTAQHMNPEAQRMFARKAEANKLDSATAIVLKRRQLSGNQQ